MKNLTMARSKILNSILSQLEKEIKLPDEIKVVSTDCVGGEVMPFETKEEGFNQLFNQFVKKNDDDKRTI